MKEMPLGDNWSRLWNTRDDLSGLITSGVSSKSYWR
jgi:hypothetical protein